MFDSNSNTKTKTRHFELQVKEPLDSEQFTVEKITLHPDFRYMLTQPDRFDIALLRLDRPVAYRDNMLPICLPTKDYPLVGKVGVVAGWGKTDNSFGKTGTNLLNKVNFSSIQTYLYLFFVIITSCVTTLN